MSGSVKVTINMDSKCRRCKKPGAAPSGLCLKCITKALVSGEYDHLLKKAKEAHERTK